MDGLMGNDVCEHAHDLRCQNPRDDDLTSWRNVVDWDAVSQR